VNEAGGKIPHLVDGLEIKSPSFFRLGLINVFQVHPMESSPSKVCHVDPGWGTELLQF